MASARRLSKATRRQLNAQWRRDGLDLDQRAHRFRQPTSAGGVGARGLESYRLANDLSQTDLAAEYTAHYGGGVTASIVSRWEAWPDGHRPIQPSLLVLQRLAVIYHTSAPTLLAAIEEGRSGHPSPPATPALVGQSLEGPPQQLALTGRRSMDGALSSPNEVLQAVPDQLADELEALELIQRVEASDLGAATLEGLTLAVDSLCRRYQVTSPADLLGAIRPYRQHVSRLLGTRATLVQRRQLMVLGGWLSLLGACVAVDLNYRQAALANRETARQLARHADHSELEAWAFEIQAWQALLDAQYPEAIELCQAGQQMAGRQTSAAAQLTVQEARAWARLGTAKETYATLERAATVLGRLPLPAHPEHHFTFDPGKLTSYAATTLAWLGNSKEAEESAREVIRYYEHEVLPGQAPRRLATARLDLALVMARQDCLEEACYLGNLALASERLVPSNIWRAAELDSALTSRHSVPEVREFHERYVAVRQRLTRSRKDRRSTRPPGEGTSEPKR